MAIEIVLAVMVGQIRLCVIFGVAFHVNWFGGSVLYMWGVVACLQ